MIKLKFLILAYTIQISLQKNIKLLREKFGPDYMSSPSIQEILKLSNKARVINLTPNASKKSSSDSEPFLLFPKG